MASTRRNFWFGLLGGCFVIALLTVHDQHSARLEEQARALRAARREAAQIRDEFIHLQAVFSAAERESKDAIWALADRLSPDPLALTNELLAPAVQLNGRDRVGSGTLIYSHVDEQTGEALNYILTAWHVVRDIIRGDEQSPIEVRLYQSADQPEDLTAYLVAKNSRIDAALLKIDTDDIFEHVAEVLPPAAEHCVAVWSEVYCVGCPLGNDPIPTSGTVSSLHNLIDGANYWMINAPAYYGNSGGAIFLADSRELIGVYSKVFTNGGNVVSHMGLMTPISSIHEWLQEEGLDHLLSVPALASSSCRSSRGRSSTELELLADGIILPRLRQRSK